MLLLPAAHIRQQCVAGAAAWVCEEHHQRLARRAQGFEGEGFSVESRESELRGLRAYRKTLFFLVEGGAILRWPYDARAFCERCLHCLKAHQKPTVLPQQMHQKPPLSGQEGEHEYPANESQQLGRRKRSESRESAGSGTAAFVARPQDEPCNGCEDSVAR